MLIIVHGIILNSSAVVDKIVNMPTRYGHLTVFISRFTLDDKTRLKLEEFLRKTDSDSSQLITQSEQQCHELDTQLHHLQQYQQQVKNMIHALSESKSYRTDSELTSAKEMVVSLRIQFSLLEGSSQEWRQEKDALVVEKEDLSFLVSHRNEDLDRLTTDLKALIDEIVNSNKKKTEALVKIEELNGLQLALEYKEKRLDHEREPMIKQQRLLQDALDQRTKEVLNVRKEKTSIGHSLQADVTKKIEELRIAQKTVSKLTCNAELKERHIKELNDRLKELSETEVKMTEINSRNELPSQMGLCELLYKSSSKNAQAKADELTKATQELIRRLLRDASARYGELVMEYKVTIDRYKELACLEKANGELFKELKGANVLLDKSRSLLLAEETIEGMSPSAAVASRLYRLLQNFDEKEKLLQGNLDSCKKQLKSLAEKNKMYAITVAKHEQSIAVLRGEAMNAQQALSRAEVNILMLREEKQLLWDAEARPVIERDSLLGEKHNESLLAVNLESIKLNLERGEAAERMRLQNNHTAAEQQTELLRKKLKWKSNSTEILSSLTKADLRLTG